MMKEEHQKLPMGKLRSVVGLRRVKYRRVKWHSAEFYIKTFLSLFEYGTLINDIVRCCLAEDGDIAYEVVDFEIRLHIVSAYALIDLPEDLDELYYILYESDLYKTVCDNANADQIRSIVESVHGYLNL